MCSKYISNMQIKRNQVLLVVLVALAVYGYTQYERYEKKNGVKEAAKKKKLSQKELNAVLKFIR